MLLLASFLPPHQLLCSAVHIALDIPIKIRVNYTLILKRDFRRIEEVDFGKRILKKGILDLNSKLLFRINDIGQITLNLMLVVCQENFFSALYLFPSLDLALMAKQKCFPCGSVPVYKPC